MGSKRIYPKSAELINRLKVEIANIPMVDVHSHIVPANPQAHDLSELLFYHYIVTELISAGMPAELIDKDKDPWERVENALPYFYRIRNTSTYRILMSMLRDLYEFDGAELTESKCRSLYNKVNKTAKMPGWHRKVLLEKAKIKRTFLSFFNVDDDELPYDKELFSGTIRIDWLVDTEFTKDTITKLSAVLRRKVHGSKDLIESLNVIFTNPFFRNIIAVGSAFTREMDFTLVDEDAIDRIIQAVLKMKPVAKENLDRVNSFMFHHILQKVEESEIPFQIMLGIQHKGDVSIPRFNSNLITDFCDIFCKYKEVKFDIFLANESQNHEIAIIAKLFPNVYISGFWWHVFYPTIMKKILHERMEILPISKINAFFSDAYYVEWSYAKAWAVRQVVAEVLADKVQDGYFGEEAALDLAEMLLSQNPKNLYALNVNGK